MSSGRGGRAVSPQVPAGRETCRRSFFLSISRCTADRGAFSYSSQRSWKPSTKGPSSPPSIDQWTSRSPGSTPALSAAECGLTFSTRRPSGGGFGPPVSAQARGDPRRSARSSLHREEQGAVPPRGPVGARGRSACRRRRPEDWIDSEELGSPMATPWMSGPRRREAIPWVAWPEAKNLAVQQRWPWAGYAWTSDVSGR